MTSDPCLRLLSDVLPTIDIGVYNTLIAKLTFILATALIRVAKLRHYSEYV